ncbi:hypothetical protein KEM55_007016, partial [Ascosphaera atra]
MAENGFADDSDSRTASIGKQSQNASKPAFRRGKKQSGKRMSKKVYRQKGRDDIAVPRGSPFSGAPLEVESGETDDDESESSSEGSNTSSPKLETQSQPPPAPAVSGASAPAANWNGTGASTIRTSLRRTQTAPAAQTDNTSKAFDTVNDMYWRARSASVSSQEQNHQGVESAQSHDPVKDADKEQGAVDHAGKADDDDLEMGEIRSPSSPRPTTQPQENDIYYGGDSDESGDEEPSELILNFSGDEEHKQRIEDLHNARRSNRSSPVREPDVEVITAQELPSIASDSEAKKAAAMHKLQSVYPVAPAILADLTRKDLLCQAKYLFYHMDINELDLRLPIRCIDCFEEGHLSLVCPNKACEHCHAWEAHDSRFCPLVRRCQNCREPGHDQEGCQAPQKTCHDVPCDLCGSPMHYETECSKLWHSTHKIPPPPQIKISLSCAYCANTGHLIGDCPERRNPTFAHPWSLQGIDPASIVNLNTAPYISGKAGPKKPIAKPKSS